MLLFTLTLWLLQENPLVCTNHFFIQNVLQITFSYVVAANNLPEHAFSSIGHTSKNVCGTMS